MEKGVQQGHTNATIQAYQARWILHLAGELPSVGSGYGSQDQGILLGNQGEQGSMRLGISPSRTCGRITSQRNVRARNRGSEVGLGDFEISRFRDSPCFR